MGFVIGSISILLIVLIFDIGRGYGEFRTVQDIFEEGCEPIKEYKGEDRYNYFLRCE